MGRKQRRDYEAAERTMREWINRATTASPYENELEQERSRIRGFLDSKDYRNLPTGVNIDLLPLAEKRRMQEMVRGRGDNTAKGSFNRDIANRQRSVDDDVLTRDWGQAYENKVGSLQDRAYGLTDTLQGLYSNRMQAGIQGSQAQLQNILNRPKGFDWGALLRAGIGASSGAIARI